jgi:hypothetical protein
LKPLTIPLDDILAPNPQISSRLSVARTRPLLSFRSQRFKTGAEPVAEFRQPGRAVGFGVVAGEPLAQLHVAVVDRRETIDDDVAGCIAPERRPPQ